MQIYRMNTIDFQSVFKMESESCTVAESSAEGGVSFSVWCGIFHYHWWTASIKPRLLFSHSGNVSWGLPFLQFIITMVNDVDGIVDHTCSNTYGEYFLSHLVIHHVVGVSRCPFCWHCRISAYRMLFLCSKDCTVYSALWSHVSSSLTSQCHRDSLEYLHAHFAVHTATHYYY